MKQLISYSSLRNEALAYWEWTASHKVPSPDPLVAKEGAGSEWRTPLMHYGTVMPVYFAVDRYLHALKLKPGAKLVELGCGTGRGLSYLKHRHPQLEIWGTDYSAACIRYAKRVYGKSGVKFVHTPAQKTVLPAAKFDVVISSHVIEHISEADGNAFLRETHRLLKPNGVAFIGTPERQHCQNLYMKNPTDLSSKRLVPPHEHEYTLTELKALAQQVFSSAKIRVDKLHNPVFLRIFSKSINTFKPNGTVLRSIANLGYRTIRDRLPKKMFDALTNLGAAYTLTSSNLTYKDIAVANSIGQEKTAATAENLLLVCQK